MIKLICTSYIETEQGLVLKDNWIEDVHNIEHLTILMKNWKIPIKITDNIKFPISDIIKGEISNPNLKIHIRIIHNSILSIIN